VVVPPLPRTTTGYLLPTLRVGKTGICFCTGAKGRRRQGRNAEGVAADEGGRTAVGVAEHGGFAVEEAEVTVGNDADFEGATVGRVAKKAS
jgi:hypothetical protein